MSSIQRFYDELAPSYDRLFLDWQAATVEQAEILDRLFKAGGFGKNAEVLDCACGIGTQTIGLAALGYSVTGSDFSAGALAEAKKRAERLGLNIRFEQADFRSLSETFSQRFDIVVAMDNALPHMLCAAELAAALGSIVNRLEDGGMFVASIRDYDALLRDTPSYTPPYIHKTAKGQNVSFQTWNWAGENYRLTQYIIEDGDALNVSKFECEYRATRREEITGLLMKKGCRRVEWLFPEETGFYQPVVIAVK